MGCLKCGRDTQEGQVFCENCLEIMQWYPVKPGTAVQLPRRQESSPRRVTKRRTPSLEDQIKSLRRTIRVLILVVILLLVLVGLMAMPVYEHVMEDHFLPGQNYSTIIPTTPAVHPRNTTGG